MKYPQWPQAGDLALIDKEEIVLVLDLKLAKEAYRGLYEVDDEDRHIWLGGDNVIHYMNIMGQVLYNGKCEWIRIERLSAPPE